MVAMINGVIAFSVIFEGPGARPIVRVIGCQHTAFTASSHNFVLTKRKCIHVTHGSDLTPLVSRAERLSTIFDNFQSMFASKFENWVHVTRPARQMYCDNSARTRT